jgi:hypothetical protein
MPKMKALKVPAALRAFTDTAQLAAALSLR